MATTTPNMSCAELQGFNPEGLDSDEAVLAALERLDTALASSTLNHKAFLEAALQQGYRLEFILSGILLAF